jgi:hypothetical protein
LSNQVSGLLLSCCNDLRSTGLSAAIGQIK